MEPARLGSNESVTRARNALAHMLKEESASTLEPARVRRLTLTLRLMIKALLLDQLELASDSFLLELREAKLLAPLRGLDVLAVASDSGRGSAMASMLTRAGAEVFPATSVEAGRSRLGRESFSVVVVDATTSGEDSRRYGRLW